MAPRNDGLSAAVSERALISVESLDGSFAQDGISPQRTSGSSSVPSWPVRTIYAGWVGAMLKRGGNVRWLLVRK